MDAQPYNTPREHLDDYLERIRLLVTRHIVRYWYRLTDRQGEIKETVVSMEEVRRSLIGIAGGYPPHERRGLPDLATIEAELVRHQERMLERLSASIPSGLGFPCENLRAIMGLSDLELDLVMLVAGVQLDVGLNRLATLAWTDILLKHPTVGFACEVLSSTRDDLTQVRQCLMPGHKLRILRVLEVVEGPLPGSGRPAPDLFQRICAPGRLLAYLLGASTQHGKRALPHCGFDDLDLVSATHTRSASLDALGQPDSIKALFRAALQQSGRVTRGADHSAQLSLSRHVPIITLTGVDDTDHAAIAHSCLGGKQPLVEIQLRHPARRMDNHPNSQLRQAIENTLAAGIREAILLQGHALVRLQDLFDEERYVAPVLDALRRVLPEARGVVLISVAKIIAPLRKLLGPCAEIQIRPPQPDRRLALWQATLAEQHIQPPFDASFRELAHRYTLAAGDIDSASHRAVFEARVQGLKKDQRIDIDHIDLAIRHQMQNKLHLLARPFTTSMTWDDVVLPKDTMERLQDMVHYGQNKRKVHEQWGFARLNSYGNGLTALFSGPPGTGKTLSAAIIARELGSELFMIDLSKVVDKYIGETEKNLGRIFDEAERSNVVLLFDEADSLFGKRTKVSSATDRYANLEVNYLLQRMEHFPGTSILTTNLDTEMDDALQRRIRFKLAFRMPDVAERALLWQKLLPPEAPITQDIDFGELAHEFELAPAFIKNAILRAAFRAAQDGLRIDHESLRDAAVAEVRELGHLVQQRYQHL